MNEQEKELDIFCKQLKGFRFKETAKTTKEKTITTTTIVIKQQN